MKQALQEWREDRKHRHEFALAGQGSLKWMRKKTTWQRRFPQLCAVCVASIVICLLLDWPQLLGEPPGTSIAVLPSKVASNDVTDAAPRRAWTAMSYFEQYTYSARMMTLGAMRQDLTDKVRGKIVLLPITDSTFKVQGLQGPPLARSAHAKVVRELTHAGAKVIAFDLLFDSPRNPADDHAFAAAARESKNVVWAAMTNDIDGERVFSRAIAPFRAASPYEGHINANDLALKQLEQPIVDRLQYATTFEGHTTPAFSLMAARLAAGALDKPLDATPLWHSSGPARIPLDASGNFKITFLGGGDDVFPEVPYEAIWRGDARREFYRANHFFRDKIVLVGDESTFGNDHSYTPVGEMSGVEIHAHAIATLLLGRFIREVPTSMNFLAIAFMGAVVCPLAAARRLGWIVVGVLSTLLAFGLFNVWLFVSYGWWLHMVAPSLALLLATLFMLIERGLFEEREREHMFDALVAAAGSAIERRDPSTSGHSQRVTALTVALAEAVSRQRKGPFRSVTFSKNQLRELRYAGLLHDFGKIGVRENVLTKSHKLDPQHFDAVVARLLVARQSLALQTAQRQLQARDSGDAQASEALEGELQARSALLDSDLALLERSNDPMVTYLPDAQYEELQQLLDRLQAMHYPDASGAMRPIISPDERESLSIRKGSLTRDEYREVQKHADLSFDFLQQIPWTDALANIPQIARSHHEKLNGTGYPQGISGADVPLQSRIMTIADIFDALTAADRPYKKAMPVDKALQILQGEAQEGALDAELLRIFIEQKVYGVTQGWNDTSPFRVRTWFRRLPFVAVRA